MDRTSVEWSSSKRKNQRENKGDAPFTELLGRTDIKRANATPPCFTLPPSPFYFAFNPKPLSFPSLMMSKFIALASLITLALAAPAARQVAGKGPQHLFPCPPHSHTFLLRGYHPTLPVELGFDCHRMHEFHWASRCLIFLSIPSAEYSLTYSLSVSRVRLRPSQPCRRTPHG